MMSTIGRAIVGDTAFAVVNPTTGDVRSCGL